jgi:hypothetical protein
MRPTSIHLLQQAVRINPNAKIAAIVQEHPKSKDEFAEALIDVYAETDDFGTKTWTLEGWNNLLQQLVREPDTLSEFMDTPEVRALIRAQEVVNANP